MSNTPGRNWSQVEPLECPACGRKFSKKGFNPHPYSCKKWDEGMEISPSDFNAKKYFQVGFFDSNLQEGVDYVECKICLNEDNKHFRKKNLSYHIKKHDVSKEDYLEAFPDHEIRRELTKKIDRKNAKKASEAAKEHQHLEDGTHVAWTDEARKKRKETNKERFGHANPFGGEQGRERAKEGMLEKYGVTNPQKDSDIREKTEETLKEEYDHDGDYFVQSDVFKEKSKETCQEKWGEDHHMKTEEVKETLGDTLEKKYGVRNPGQIKNWEEMEEIFLEKFGVSHPLKLNKFLEKRRKTVQEKYGEDNVSQAGEIKQKIKQTWRENYGQPFPPQSLNIDLPTSIERKVTSNTPDRVIYTGDFKFWVVDEETGNKRCPDHIILSQNQYDEYSTYDDMELSDFTPQKVIECNGDFWHSEEVTGLPKQTHENEQKSFYESFGIDCIVLWEDEIKSMSESEFLNTI